MIMRNSNLLSFWLHAGHYHRRWVYSKFYCKGREEKAWKTWFHALHAFCLFGLLRIEISIEHIISGNKGRKNGCRENQCVVGTPLSIITTIFYHFSSVGNLYPFYDLLIITVIFIVCLFCIKHSSTCLIINTPSNL